MRIKLYILALVSAVFLSVSYVFPQAEAPTATQAQPEITPIPDENISWVWGEVKSVDPVSMTFNIIYMDYQTDEEKELVLSADHETKLEGASDFSGIKAGDTASIDYIVKDGKNIPRNISIEKIEEMPEAPVKAEDVIKPPAP